MSAELLRHAAEKIRTEQEWNKDAGRITDYEYASWLAVADWLDEVAWRSENYPKQYRAAKHAATVARAYLGDNT